MRIVLLCALVWLAGWASAKELSGTVLSVTDGDTLILRVACADLEVVARLAGIDAPESGQRFGKKAAQALRARVAGRTVAFSYYKRDKYGRLVGTARLDGADVNLAQVVEGWAWHSRAFEHEQSSEDRRRYAEAESAARSARLGLWNDKTPTPPWAWRDGHPTEMAEAELAEAPSDAQGEAFSFTTFEGEVVHIGPRGGRYIVLPNGGKRYLSQDE